MNQKIIDTITLLANINSGSYHYEGCFQNLECIKSLIQPITSNIKYHSSKEIIHIYNNGTKSELRLAPILHAKINPNVLKRVCLFGHVDSVFAKESTFQTVTQKGNILYGPAVSDMKGGIVVMIEAIKKFLNNTKSLNIGLDILLNSDEEIGSLSSSDYFLSQCPFITVALGYEPALPCGNFAGERKGGITFSVLAKGQSAHAGRDFHKGRNAISALSRLAIYCDDLWQEYDDLSINVGEFVGGTSVNSVPDTAVMRVNMRSYSNIDMQTVITKIKDYMEKVASKYEVTLEYHERNYRTPKVNFEKQIILQNYISNLCKSDGVSHDFIPTGGMCDGNLFSGQGIPTIDTLGAIGGKIHTFDEFLNIDALENRINLTYKILNHLNATQCEL